MTSVTLERVTMPWELKPLGQEVTRGSEDGYFGCMYTGCGVQADDMKIKDEVLR